MSAASAVKSTAAAATGWLMKGETLQESFDPRDNALNSLRLLLAASVIVGHAYGLGGYGPGAMARPCAYLTSVAVDGFFAISGFLITRSWVLGRGWGRYLWHRFLRIFPGFWVCLLVTSLVVAPIGVWHGQAGLSLYYSDPNGPLGFITNNIVLQNMRFGGLLDIAGSPQGIPIPLQWNGSLWTLSWEFLCYLGVGAVGSLVALAKRRIWAVVMLALFWLLALLHELQPQIWAYYFTSVATQSFIRFPLMFLAGAVLYLYADRVVASGKLATISLIAFALSFLLLDDYRILGGPALAYMVVWLGARLPVRIGVRTDISYGVYVYAFPVQQLLAVLGAHTYGWPVYAALGIAGTVPLAFASWFMVERPALRAKSWRPGRRRAVDDIGVPPAAQGDAVLAEPKGQEIPDVGASGALRARVTGAVVMSALFLGYLVLKVIAWPNP